LSVLLQFTASDYPFGIFKLFLHVADSKIQVQYTIHENNTRNYTYKISPGSSGHLFLYTSILTIIQNIEYGM